MKLSSPVSAIVAFCVLALLFVGAATMAYGSFNSELVNRQRLDHDKLHRIVAEALRQFFLQVQQVTSGASTNEAFDPKNTEAEDRLRYVPVDSQRAKALAARDSIQTVLQVDNATGSQRTEKILTWQIFKGIPERDPTGRPLAVERRRIFKQASDAFPHLLFMFEEDANGDIILLEPYWVQTRLGSFNFDFRDYLSGAKSTKATTLSEAYVSGDVRSTQAVAVSSPIFDKSGNIVKIVAASVENRTIREEVFQKFNERAGTSDGTHYYLIDHHGHVVASSSTRPDYTPVQGASTDEFDPGNFRKYGPLASIVWQNDEFEKGTKWHRHSQTWAYDQLKPFYMSNEYIGHSGRKVVGTFFPVSLIDTRAPRYGILVETPVDAIHGIQNLMYVFFGTVLLLLIILYVLSRTIWVSYTRMTKEIAEKDQKIEDVCARVAHDLRSPLVALQLIQPNLQEQPENVRNMFRRTINSIQDIATDLLQVQAPGRLRDANKKRKDPPLAGPFRMRPKK